MKTLVPGRPQKGMTFEAECTGYGNGGGGCGAKLEVEQGDLFKWESHTRDETTHYITFRCHDCGVLTDVWDSDSRRSLGVSVEFTYSLLQSLPSKNSWFKAHSL